MVYNHTDLAGTMSELSHRVIRAIGKIFNSVIQVYGKRSFSFIFLYELLEKCRFVVLMF